MRKQPALAEDSGDIDLTPMLDVVFIMLIFFIVTASFVKESVIDTAIPDQPPVTERTETPSILVEVRANNEIWMEQRRVDIRAVRANIERMHAESPEAPVVIQAHVKSTAKMYVAVADAAREARVYSVALMPVSDSI
ncbi:biopolymer transporter ExbD [Simiduia litorea]|uniref:ExbD/TolR family protein n=1 Tax=Simiduia litorea TaxID=1435348 RepID=UPI0036F41D32